MMAHIARSPVAERILRVALLCVAFGLPLRAAAGALTGGGIGGLIGAAIIGSSGTDHTGGGAEVVIGGGVALGALIGGGIGLARRTEEWMRLWPNRPD